MTRLILLGALLLSMTCAQESYTMKTPPTVAANGLDTAALKVPTGSPLEVFASSCNELLNMEIPDLVASPATTAPYNDASYLPATVLNLVGKCLLAYVNVSEPAVASMIGNITNQVNNLFNVDVTGFAKNASTQLDAYVKGNNRTSITGLGQQVKRIIGNFSTVPKLENIKVDNLAKLDAFITEANEDFDRRNASLIAMSDAINGWMSNVYSTFNASVIVNTQPTRTYNLTTVQALVKNNITVNQSYPPYTGNLTAAWISSYDTFAAAAVPACGNDASASSTAIQGTISDVYTSIQNDMSGALTAINTKVGVVGDTFKDWMTKLTGFSQVAEEFRNLTNPGGRNMSDFQAVATTSLTTTLVPALYALNITLNSTTTNPFLSNVTIDTSVANPDFSAHPLFILFKKNETAFKDMIAVVTSSFLATSVEATILAKIKDLLPAITTAYNNLMVAGVSIANAWAGLLARPATLTDSDQFPTEKTVEDIMALVDNFFGKLDALRAESAKVNITIGQLPVFAQSTLQAAPKFRETLIGYIDNANLVAGKIIFDLNILKGRVATHQALSDTRWKTFLSNDLKRLDDGIKNADSFIFNYVKMVNLEYKSLMNSVARAKQDIANLADLKTFNTKLATNLFTKFVPTAQALPTIPSTAYAATVTWSTLLIPINATNVIKIATDQVIDPAAAPADTTNYFITVNITNFTYSATPYMLLSTFISKGVRPTDGSNGVTTRQPGFNPFFYTADEATTARTAAQSTAELFGLNYFATPATTDVKLKGDYKLIVAGISNSYLVFMISTKSTNLLNLNLVLNVTMTRQ